MEGSGSLKVCLLLIWLLAQRGKNYKLLKLDFIPDLLNIVFPLKLSPARKGALRWREKDI